MAERSIGLVVKGEHIAAGLVAGRSRGGGSPPAIAE